MIARCRGLALLLATLLSVVGCKNAGLHNEILSTPPPVITDLVLASDLAGEQQSATLPIQYANRSLN